MSEKKIELMFEGESESIIRASVWYTEMNSRKHPNHFRIDKHAAGRCCYVRMYYTIEQRDMRERTRIYGFVKNDYNESESDVGLHIWSNSC